VGPAGVKRASAFALAVSGSTSFCFGSTATGRARGLTSSLSTSSPMSCAKGLRRSFPAWQTAADWLGTLGSARTRRAVEGPAGCCSTLSRCCMHPPRHTPGGCARELALAACLFPMPAAPRARSRCATSCCNARPGVCIRQCVARRDQRHRAACGTIPAGYCRGTAQETREGRQRHSSLPGSGGSVGRRRETRVRVRAHTPAYTHNTRPT